MESAAFARVVLTKCSHSAYVVQLAASRIPDAARTASVLWSPLVTTPILACQTVEMPVTYFEDAQPITALPHRYCSGVNRGDYAAIASCFAEDSEWSFEAPWSEGQRRDAPVRGPQGVADVVRGAYEHTLAFVTQLIGVVDIVSIDGDVGHLYTFFEARNKSYTGRSIYLVGVYDDYVARFPTGWLFTRRAGQTIYWDDVPLPGNALRLSI